MHAQRIMKTLSATVVLLGAWAPASWGQNGGSTPMPAPEVWRNDNFAHFRTGVSKPYVEVTVRYDAYDKTIEVKCIHRVDSGPAASSVTKAFSLSYWPTSIAPLDDGFGKFLIAGKTSRGRTRIEEYHLQTPLLIQTPLPGGGIHYSISEPAVTSVTEVLDEKTSGLDMVPHLIPSLADPRSAFVQFWDSKDLYALDLDTQLYTLVASPTGAGLTVPSLNDDFDTFWSFEHLDQGYVYVLYNTDSGARTVFLDSDLDGVLDFGGHLSPSQWEALGLSDRTKYVP